MTTTPLRLAVTGATGRMGRAVLAEATARGHAIPVAVARSPDAESVAVEGVSVAPAAELERLLAEREPDALVDFTGPDSSVAYVRAAAAEGVPAVVGTTGFDEEQAAALRQASETVPVLRAANFSRGVRALERAVREAVDALEGYDVELTETHHNGKRDAPSGTAKELLDAIEAERAPRGSDGDSSSEPDEVAASSGTRTKRVHGREGEVPRSEGEIGVHARRAGDVTGEHEVLLAGNDEVLTLTHRAESRGVFAAGALDAAEWIVPRPAGFYGFDAVIDA